MDRQAEHAGEIFRQGFNCAQAVLCAFGNQTGLDEDTAKRLASPFGGGMGSLKGVCGALTGAFMVLGLTKGFTDPSSDNKRIQRERTDGLIAAFRERFGEIHCRALLARAASGGDAKIGARPCLKYVVAAVEILAGKLAEMK